MTKRQVAKKLYKQKGDCWGVMCPVCLDTPEKCTEKRAYDLARNWLRENPEPKMKRRTYVIAAILILLCFTMIHLFSGCVIVDELRDEYYEEQYRGLSLYRGDVSQIYSPECIPLWMRERVSYEETKETQTMEESLKRGKCDCDGYVLMYMNIMYIRFGGIKCDLVLTDTDTDRKVVEGGHIDHAVVRLPSGILINAQYGYVYEGSVAYIYTFDEVFNED